MKKAKGSEYAPRDKPKKRPGKHKKSLSKSEKRNNKNKKYKGQGKGWHCPKISYIVSMKGNKMKVKEITIHDTLRQEIKQLKEEARVFNAYKKLILTAARSEYDSEDVVEGLKFAAKLIKEKNWALLEKVGGTSGDLMVRGECSKCGINLVGKGPAPRNLTLPCLIQGCT